MFYAYLTISILCFLVSLFTYKYIVALKIFPWLLGLGLLTEFLGYAFQNILHIDPFLAYHLSTPLLCLLEGVFYYQAMNEGFFKRILQFILLGFVLASYCLSYFFYHFSGFPGLQLNMGAIILVICSAYVLLTLEPIYHLPIYKHPLAWISMGTIIFYCSIFFLNGIYNYLVQSKSDSRDLIHAIINNGANCIYYSCIIVGLICSHRLKKYSV